MVKTGAFSHHKEIDDFDFEFQEIISKAPIMDFLSHRFIHEKENIIFLGNSVVGKTYLATSIGISVANKRMSTYFIKCHDWYRQSKKSPFVFSYFGQSKSKIMVVIRKPKLIYLARVCYAESYRKKTFQKSREC